MAQITTDPDLILAVNAGSSSLKIGFFKSEGHNERCVLSGQADRIGQPDSAITISNEKGDVLVQQHQHIAAQQDALHLLYQHAIQQLGALPACVGYRVVHGGPKLRNHIVIDEDVIKDLKEAEHFAPLHIPVELTLIAAMRKLLPDAVHCACLDTTFHRTLPEAASRLPLPDSVHDAGVQRYGFHGLSYDSVVRRMKNDLPERMIIAHLGNGSSLCAVRHGRSIDTTMCLTPTGGIPMATRSGDLDPGIPLFLLRNHAMTLTQLDTMLNHQSGLIALSGGLTDMRDILAKRDKQDAKADLAVTVYTLAIRKTIGAYAALLGGVDRVVFAGGIGEHSSAIRDMVCGGLEFLGITLDPESSNVVVMTSEEEQQIAHICRCIA